MLKKYLKLSETSLKTLLAYRLNIFTGLANSILFIVAMWFIWKAIFASAGTAEIQGLTFQIMLTYLIISSFIRTYSNTNIENHIEGDVRSGAIARKMTMPTNYLFYRFFEELGESFYKMAVFGLPVILGSLFFIRVAPPASMFFFVSIVLGFLINFLIAFLTGMWVFWSEGSIWGLKLSRRFIEDIVSGSGIPLYFFPAWLASIFYLLPFQAIYNIPLSIYIGKISGIEIFSSLGQQVLWIAILGILSILLWQRAKKKMFSQGG